MIKGSYKKRDILLLRHEHLERAFEKRYNLTYREAHVIASKKYDWAAVIQKLFSAEGGMENVDLRKLSKD